MMRKKTPPPIPQKKAGNIQCPPPQILTQISTEYHVSAVPQLLPLQNEVGLLLPARDVVMVDVMTVGDGSRRLWPCTWPDTHLYGWPWRLPAHVTVTSKVGMHASHWWQRSHMCSSVESTISFRTWSGGGWRTATDRPTGDGPFCYWKITWADGPSTGGTCLLKQPLGVRL